MSLREEILSNLPDYVDDVTVDRTNLKGIDSIKVVVDYHVGTKKMFLDINFAQKNKMTADHMAKVIESYIKVN